MVSFAPRPVLCVTLDGEIVGRWVFADDSAMGVVSVTKSIGLRM